MIHHDANLVHTLGWTVLHFLWQGLLIGLGAAALLRGFRQRTAQARYAIACGALAASLSAFVVTFLVLANATQSGSEVAIALPLSMVATVPTAATGGQGFLNYVAFGWALGVGAMLIRFGRHWLWSHRLKTQHISAPEELWLRTFEQLKADLRVSQTVQLLRSSLAQTPMVIGWFAPVVLVPVSAFTSLTPEQLRSILAHELAHIRRHDHWVNMCQGIIEIVLFFHPATWWLSQQIQIEREYCCDETSVQTAGDPRVLAEALAQLELLRISIPSHALAANDGSLMDRITRILDKRVKTKNTKENTMKTKTIGILTAAVLLIGGLLIAQADDKPKPQKPNPLPTKEKTKPQSPSDKKILPVGPGLGEDPENLAELFDTLIARDIGIDGEIIEIVDGKIFAISKDGKRKLIGEIQEMDVEGLNPEDIPLLEGFPFPEGFEIPEGFPFPEGFEIPEDFPFPEDFEGQEAPFELLLLELDQNGEPNLGGDLNVPMPEDIGPDFEFIPSQGKAHEMKQKLEALRRETEKVKRAFRELFERRDEQQRDR